jgi:hypothetical protein
MQKLRAIWKSHVDSDACPRNEARLRNAASIVS